MTTKISDFRSVFEEALGDIAARTLPEKRCLILSGGVDTCAILTAAAQNLDLDFPAGITVSCGDCPDRDFAVAAAQDYNNNNNDAGLLFHHEMISTTPKDLVSNYLPDCVGILHTFDGMTLRNSLVVAAAFHKAAELGFTDVIVGDGADELLGGYSFMWGCEDDTSLWKEKRDSMCAKWTFATEALAKHYGLTSHSPYMEPKLVEWVIANVERADCIGNRQIQLVHQGEKVEHTTGKILLREAYETVASWRRKDPIEVGSGITVIGKDDYWNFKLSDEEFQAQIQQLKVEGFVIKTKEYLINFRAFQACFGENGETFPNTKRLSVGQGCAGCCFEIGDKVFCTICGTYPAQRTNTI